MPTSVLLAVLAGAGLLALAPALVRRYDADERIAAEREQSQARVLDRKSRGRTGPGANPINPPSQDESPEEPIDTSDSDNAIHAETPPLETGHGEPAPPPSRRRGWERSGARYAESVTLRPSHTSATGHKEAAVASARLRSWWQRRYRRVLYVLLALNFVELLGVILVGPGFWLGVAASLCLLMAFLRFLRLRVLRESGERRRVANPAIAGGRQVYVPAQPDGDQESPAQIEAAPRDSATGLVPGFDDEDDDDQDDEPAPPPRRRTGGIRGRSYESPANL